MAEHQIRFGDGATYERMMGAWSQLVGTVFLDWLAPTPGLRWLDVGCGSGAFSELLYTRCAPAKIEGIDPSEAQLAFARGRPAARLAQFRLGDATALPYPDDRFDAAVMALVIFFLPDAARGVAEMARVVKPGGTVATYAWDLTNDGLPTAPILAELREMGFNPPMPANPAASRLDTLRELWAHAGIEGLETREIRVTRTFADFEDFWTITAGGSAGLVSLLGSLDDADTARLTRQVSVRLPADAAGQVTYASHATAIRGRLPK